MHTTQTGPTLEKVAKCGCRGSCAGGLGIRALLRTRSSHAPASSRESGSCVRSVPAVGSASPPRRPLLERPAQSLRPALLCFPGRQPCAWRRELPDGTWVGGTGGRWGVSPCLPLATPLPHGFFRGASLAELFRSLLLADICNTMLSVAEIPFLNALPGAPSCLLPAGRETPATPGAAWGLELVILFVLCLP